MKWFTVRQAAKQLGWTKEKVYNEYYKDKSNGRFFKKERFRVKVSELYINQIRNDSTLGESVDTRND